MFIRKEEQYVVDHTIQFQNPLAYLLARPLNSSYKWLFELRYELSIFDSVMAILQEDQKLCHRGFAPFGERNITKSHAAKSLLRAGFLVHFHIKIYEHVLGQELLKTKKTVYLEYSPQSQSFELPWYEYLLVREACCFEWTISPNFPLSYDLQI